jgi:aerobic carbon-monoxide dehydrogenase large subunit
MGRRGRREDARLVTGRGTFVSNDRREEMLYAGFVRSYLAHGIVEQVDVSAATDLDGVVAAFTGDDLELREIPGSTGRGPSADGMTRPPLARDRVRYVGEPLAIVLGTSRSAVADGMEQVIVDLDPLPVVADTAAALRDETQLHPAAGTNVVGRLEAPAGGVVPDLDRWPVQVEVVVESPRLAPVTVEPLSILAEVVGGVLHVRCGHQAPHRLQRQLAQLLELDVDRVRVIVPDNGGGFGMRGMLFPEHVVVAAAALRLQRPVLWTETRTESFQGGTHGRAMSHRVRLAGDRAGRIRAGHIQITAEVGGYPHNGSHVPGFAQLMGPGNYDIPELKVETTIVVTNRAPTGSYRGAGRPEATLAIERAVEAFGHAAGLDAVEVRRRNLVPGDAMPYRSPTGALYDSGDYPAALDALLELVDLEAVRADQAGRSADDPRALGVGIAMFVERAGGAADSAEYARVEVDLDGHVVVRAGTAASGQGHDTVWSAIAGRVFDGDPDDVEVVTGDTARVSSGVGSFASRSAQVGGSAILRRSEVVRDQVLALAGQLLEVDVADLEVSAGSVGVRGAPHLSLTLAEVARAAQQRGEELASEESYSPHAQTFPYGAAAAIVEVDTETGAVDLRRLVAVDDCGTVLDEMIVEGQVHGSLVQGIGQALFEEIVYDEQGQLITSTLMDYLAPTAADLPSIETGRLVHPAPSNPLGAKGSGESGCLGAPPAIVHAVLDALRDHGVRELQVPVTPRHVFDAIAAARLAGDEVPVSGVSLPA